METQNMLVAYRASGGRHKRVGPGGTGYGRAHIVVDVSGISDRSDWHMAGPTVSSRRRIALLVALGIWSSGQPNIYRVDRYRESHGTLYFRTLMIPLAS